MNRVKPSKSYPFAIAAILLGGWHYQEAAAQAPAAPRRARAAAPAPMTLEQRSDQSFQRLGGIAPNLTSERKRALSGQIAVLSDTAAEAAALEADAVRLMSLGLTEAQVMAEVSMSDKRADDAKAEAATQQANKEFLGLKWGLGVAAVIGSGGDERVQEASVVDGVVRVTKDASNTARIFAEIHKFWPKGGAPNATSGRGFFVGIQSSSDEVLDSLATGYMWGWRLPPEDPKQASSRSLNIGLGVVLDPKVQVLGDGITKDQPLPGNETEIRYKEESKTGLGLFFSFSF